MLVGRLVDGRVTVLFPDMVAGGRGTSRRRQPDGRRSRFDPCMPGWLGVGRFACGLFTVNWRLQLRCGRCRGCLGRLMVGWVCVGFVAPLPVVVSPNVVCAADTSLSALASCVLVGPRAAQCGLSALVGRVRNGRVAVFCRVRWHGRRRAWRTTVPPSRWTPFPFRPVHAALVWCWPACVWSVYGHVAAAAGVWLVRGCCGRLMFGWVRVGSVALLPVVLSSNPAHVAGTFVPALVSCKTNKRNKHNCEQTRSLFSCLPKRC